ncbi:MAG: YraN family protein [Candidatus Eremiobacteraeota bacterium]|nr:YraN family protein [Candidatus Eremiobacteraeota bacterium]
MNRRELGRAGEDAAVAYLTERGFQIVGRNVRLGNRGEIDVVARDGETIVFVEVKARQSQRFGSAATAVDARKRRTLRKLAAEWLQLFAPQSFARFDVLAADGERFRYYRDAFQ